MTTQCLRTAGNLTKRFVPHAFRQVQVDALIGQPPPTPLAQQLAYQDARVNDETHNAEVSSRWLR